MGRDKIDEKTINNLMVTDYISCNFYRAEPNSAVHLYVGYHERQTRDRESGKATAIHPPEHCLPGSGWDVIDSQVVPINFLEEAGAGPAGEAKRFVIAKGNQRSLVYFWYHSRGRVIARSHHKILWMFLDRARLGRTDGSLVRFTVPIQFGDEEAAEALREYLIQVFDERMVGVGASQRCEGLIRSAPQDTEWIISYEDLEEVLRHRRDSALGPDGLPYAMEPRWM